MTPSTKGILLMLGAMATLPFMDVLAKFLGQWGMPILIVVWARLTFGTVVTLPFAKGRGPLWPDRPLFHSLRAGLLAGATFLFFMALKHLPIADALAIFFVQPLIVTVLSAVVLKEKVTRIRLLAVLAGFVAVLIIIRPGLQPFNPGTLYALGAGVFLAVYFIMTRQITGSAPAMVTTFQTNLMGAIWLSFLLPFVWQSPSALEWAMLFSLGLIATFGHFLIVRAYDFAEASLLAPFAFTEMVMAIVLGWVFFSDLPDFWTITGVVILFVTSFLAARAERRAEMVADLHR